MQLSQNFSPIAETLLKLPHTKIAKLIGFVLFIYIAYLLAKITWLFLEPSPQNNLSATHTIITQNNAPSQSISLSSIHSLNLFGLYNESSAVVEETDEIEDAPETNLKLTLTGVVASNEEDKSAAIIQNNGAQEIYAIDETIEGTRAVLKKVYNDRVHIRHSGRLETLMLDGFDYSESNNKQQVSKRKPKQNIRGPIQGNNKKRLDQRNNANLTKQAQALRKDINEDPGKITDYLKIGPKRVNGKIIGYQLMPGRNPEFFKSSGLKNGDVAIQMNGYDLSQPAEAAQALRALKEEQEVSLLLDRNGDITEILFSINE